MPSDEIETNGSRTPDRKEFKPFVLVSGPQTSTSSRPGGGLLRAISGRGSGLALADANSVKMLSEAASLPNPASPPRYSIGAAEVPAAVALQPPAIVQAWREAQAAISENERLAHPMAEPYFARAEILSLAKDFDSALLDYLRALSIAGRTKDNAIAYSAYFERLQQSLENYNKDPRPLAAGDARTHFGAGIHSYREGDLDAAKKHFTNAIALDNSSAPVLVLPSTYFQTSR